LNDILKDVQTQVLNECDTQPVLISPIILPLFLYK